MALQRYPAYSAGFNARGKSPGMNTIHREVIDIHQNELVETMETRTVVRELLTQGMLGDFHCQQLEYVYPEGRIVANRLLLAFVRKQGSAGYHALLRALAVCDATGVVAKMIHTEKEVCKVLGTDYNSQTWCCRDGPASVAPCDTMCRAGSSAQCTQCLSELETKVNVLMHLLRNPMFNPGSQTDSDQQLAALEREVDELEMTLEKLRPPTTSGGQDTDANKGKAGVSDTEEPAKEKAVVAVDKEKAVVAGDKEKAVVAGDLDQRMTRVEKLLGLGPGVSDFAGQSSPSSDREQRLNKLEEKVARMKVLAKSLVKNPPSSSANESKSADKDCEEKPAQYGL
ncbi:uncharacterized protein LOC112571268 [Pomacea canaliculata]|uniref:uncharacterized protein LOC112571268 n=1 Tax=Pomacea canaliculata TaxID=400727 RepID=UPI000D734347|nr:uncharacterized protein LOC112571268 [Pomacea canaliculata]XP_025105934.1 uncharacterized protein LOC112571268 [Pomacea canaliculata]